MERRSKLDSQYKNSVVSRIHCKITGSTDRAGAARFVVSDNQSLNGLSVNKVRVKEHVLKDNDLLSLGGCAKIAVGHAQDAHAMTDVTYRFHWLVPVDGAAAAAAGAAGAAAVDLAAVGGVSAADESAKKRKEPADSAAAADNDHNDDGDEDDDGDDDGGRGAAVTNKRGKTSGGELDRLLVDAKKAGVPKHVEAPRFKVGDRVEAQSNNTVTREVDAWFDGKVVSVNVRARTYKINFDGYGHEFDEHLAFKRVRERSDGDWSFGQIVEGKTRMLVQWRQRELWYDALVIEKLADPALPSVGLNGMCLRCRWIDNPCGMSARDAQKEFDTNMTYAFYPQQSWGE